MSSVERQIDVDAYPELGADRRKNRNERADQSGQIEDEWSER